MMRICDAYFQMICHHCSSYVPSPYALSDDGDYYLTNSNDDDLMTGDYLLNLNDLFGALMSSNDFLCDALMSSNGDDLMMMMKSLNSLTSYLSCLSSLLMTFLASLILASREVVEVPRTCVHPRSLLWIREK
jgi:hypothetical protein